VAVAIRPFSGATTQGPPWLPYIPPLYPSHLGGACHYLGATGATIYFDHNGLKRYNSFIMIYKKLILSALLLLTLGTSFTASYAIDYREGEPTTTINPCDDITKTGVPKPPYCTGSILNKELTFPQQIKFLVDKVNSFLYVLVPSIAVIAIIVGAFNILQNSFKVGVAIIQWALIGMVVVLLSSAIISLVVRIVVGG
jgi:hypothetical protein